MNRKLIVALMASLMSVGAFAAPHHRPPPPRPIHHAHHHHHHHAQAMIGGFIGGVVGGVVYHALAADPVVVSQPVVVQQPAVVVQPAPVVVQPPPPAVVQQSTVQNVWVEGRYVDQVQPNGSVVRVWQPGHYEQRTVIVQ